MLLHTIPLIIAATTAAGTTLSQLGGQSQMSALMAKLMPGGPNKSFESESCAALLSHYENVYTRGNPRAAMKVLRTLINQVKTSSAMAADAKVASALDVLNSLSRTKSRKIPYTVFLQFTKCYTDPNSKRYLYADMVRKNMYKTVTHKMAQFFHTPEDYKRLDANQDSLLHDAVHSLNDNMVSHVLDDAGDMTLTLLRGRNAQNKRPLDLATDLGREDIVTTLKNRHKLEDDTFVDTEGASSNFTGTPIGSTSTGMSAGAAPGAGSAMGGMVGMNPAFMSKLRGKAQQPASIAHSQLAAGMGGGVASSPPQASSAPLNAAMSTGTQPASHTASQYAISGLSQSVSGGGAMGSAMGGSQAAAMGKSIAPGSAAFATTPSGGSMMASQNNIGGSSMASDMGGSSSSLGSSGDDIGSTMGSVYSGLGGAAGLQGIASQPPTAASDGSGTTPGSAAGMASQPATDSAAASTNAETPQEKPANETSILGSIWALVHAGGRK